MKWGLFSRLLLNLYEFLKGVYSWIPFFQIFTQIMSTSGKPKKKFEKSSSFYCRVLRLEYMFQIWSNLVHKQKILRENSVEIVTFEKIAFEDSNHVLRNYWPHASYTHASSIYFIVFGLFSMLLNLSLSWAEIKTIF